MHARRFLSGTAAVSVAVGTLLLGSAGSALADDAPTTVVEESVVDGAVDDSTDDGATDDAADASRDAATADAPTVRGVAAAYSGLTITPAGPYKGGEKVTVRGSGFEPNEQVVLSICLGGQFLAGPQDCAPLNGSSSAIGAANGSGSASLSIDVVDKGAKLGAQSKPSAVCDNGAGHCVFSLTNFSGKGPDSVRVKYVESGGSQGTTSKSSSKKKSASKASNQAANQSSTSTGGSDATGGTTASTDTTNGGAEVANTGAGSAMSSAALGAALLVLGLGLSVAGRRWTPRTTRD